MTNSDAGWDEDVSKITPVKVGNSGHCRDDDGQERCRAEMGAMMLGKEDDAMHASKYMSLDVDMHEGHGDQNGTEVMRGGNSVVRSAARKDEEGTGNL